MNRILHRVGPGGGAARKFVPGIFHIRSHTPVPSVTPHPPMSPRAEFIFALIAIPLGVLVGWYAWRLAGP